MEKRMETALEFWDYMGGGNGREWKLLWNIRVKEG